MKKIDENKVGYSMQRSGLSRRDFLKLGGAGLAGAMVLGTAGTIRVARAQSAVDLVFGFGPDETGTLQKIIDNFNIEYDGKIRVHWREMARESDAYFRQMRSDFLAGAADIDVFGGDIVWTAEFAHNRWIQDLSSLFHQDYDADDFMGAALNSAAYKARVWGVPWYTDAGMLFYRKDLLEQSGFEKPPATWDQLKEMAGQIQQDAGTRHGLVFQGADYEGGVTNALEYIWGAGGDVMLGSLSFSPQLGINPGDIDPNVIVVDSPEAARGLDIARSMISEGVAPETVTRFRELEATQAFLAGDAVFMRNWPYAYGSLIDPEQSAITAEQVGIAPMPVTTANRSWSCLGGWNLMVSALSTKQEAAWTFIRYATASEQQRLRALEGGFLPTLLDLYDDPDIQQAMPVIVQGREALANSRMRPVSPFYSQMSPRISRAFNLTLRGDLNGQEAVQRLSRELGTILLQNR